MLGISAILQRRTLSVFVLASALLIPKLAFALTCGQTNFSGAWRAAGDGIICDLQVGSSGSASGSCYSEVYDQARGRVTIEHIRISGFIGFLNDCELSGRLELENQPSIAFRGHTWSAVTGRPDVARIVSENESGAALYLIRASSG